MNNNIEKLLESIENIKEKINDNEYKNLIEQLNDVHKEDKNPTVVYEFIVKTYSIKQVPRTFHDSYYENEKYVLDFVLDTHNETSIIDKKSDLYKFLKNNENKIFYDEYELRKIFGECVNDDSFLQVPPCFQSYSLDKHENDEELYIPIDLILNYKKDTIKTECLSKTLFHCTKFNEIKYVPF